MYRAIFRLLTGRAISLGYFSVDTWGGVTAIGVGADLNSSTTQLSLRHHLELVFRSLKFRRREDSDKFGASQMNETRAGNTPGDLSFGGVSSTFYSRGYLFGAAVVGALCTLGRIVVRLPSFLHHFGLSQGGRGAWSQRCHQQRLVYIFARTANMTQNIHVVKHPAC